VIGEALKYQVFGDAAAGGREIAPRPEMAAPIALLDLRKLLLDTPGRTPFDPAHNVAQRVLRWHRDEHVDVIFRQNALDDLYAEFSAGLANDLTHPAAKLATQNVIAILGRPTNVIAVTLGRWITSLA